MHCNGYKWPGKPCATDIEGTNNSTAQLYCSNCIYQKYRRKLYTCSLHTVTEWPVDKISALHIKVTHRKPLTI